MTLLFVNEYKAKYTLEQNLESKKCTGKFRNERTRRPRNAFILYRQENQKIISSSSSNLHSKEISKIIAKMWKNENEEVRLKYERLAEVEKLKHIVNYPQYKYAPRQRKKSPLTTPMQTCIVQQDKETPTYSNFDKVKIPQFNDHKSMNEALQNENLFTVEDLQLLEDITNYIPQDNTLTLPSEILDDSQILPYSTELDLMSIKDYELYTLLSVMSKF